jgi:magnesium-transporting ATPase (P-type)
VKPGHAAKAKREMMLLGVGSIFIAIALFALAVVLLILYSQIKGSSLLFSSTEVSSFLQLALLATATMTFFFVAVAAITLRSRKHLRDEPPAIAGPNQALCAECNRPFELQSLIEYHGQHVCAHCKPIFLQKLTEGAQPLETKRSFRSWGFWICVLIISVLGAAIILNRLSHPIPY